MKTRTLSLEPYACGDPKICESLQTQGFALLPGFVDVAAWQRCIRLEDGSVDYSNCQWPHIRKLVDKISTYTGWDAALSKYRVSAGTTLPTSNATDAANFHRDIMVYDEIVPAIFTMVVYLDSADLRVVPGSHRKLHMNWKDSLSLSKYQKIVHFEPGDAMLFHATLLHGGVFPQRQPEAPRPRRIIQLFDIYPTRKVPGEPHTCDKVLHIWAPDKDLPKGKLISRIVHSIAAPLVVWGGGVSTAAGYGHPYFKPPAPYTILSGESMRVRANHDDPGWMRGNAYILAKHGCDVHDPDDDATNESIRQFIYQDLQVRTLGTRAVLPGLGLVLLFIALVYAAVFYARRGG